MRCEGSDKVKQPLFLFAFAPTGFLSVSLSSSCASWGGGGGGGGETTSVGAVIASRKDGPTRQI